MGADAMLDVIVAALRERGARLQDVAATADVTPAQLSRFLHGKYGADPMSSVCRRMQRALARYLGPEGAATVARFVTELRLEAGGNGNGNG